MSRIFIFFLLFSYSFMTLAEVHPFTEKSKRAILLGYSRNLPIFHSANQYESYIYNPILGIRHVSEKWVLGISTQFKFMKDRIAQESLILWTLTEEVQYKFRLYHPLYLLVGGKFLYLLPVKTPSFPFVKREDFNSEIGVAASLSLLYFFPKDFAFGVFVDLWRGTGSQKFEALEMGIQIMIPLSF